MLLFSLGCVVGIGLGLLVGWASDVSCRRALRSRARREVRAVLGRGQSDALAAIVADRIASG